MGIIKSYFENDFFLQRRKREKMLAFQQERADTVWKSTSELINLILELSNECGPIGVGADFAKGVQIMPLFAIGEILSAQGQIYPEQEPLLKLLIASLNSAYNYAQFIDITVHRKGPYSAYWEQIGLDQEHCGQTWLTLFEMIYRSRNMEIIQTINLKLTEIAINFELVGLPASVFGKTVSSNLAASLQHHINLYQKTPYIYAILLLQSELLRQRSMAVETHFFIREDGFSQDGREFYVYSVYDKETHTFQGKYAVRRNRDINGYLDYENDKDLITVWDQSQNQFITFYKEP